MPKSIKLLTLSAMALIIQACASVGPEYEGQEIAEKALPETLTLNVIEREIQWWKHFNDRALDQIVELAIANNLSLKKASANVDRSLAVFKDSENDHLPTGAIEANYSVQDQVAPGLSEARQNSRSYELGASLSWSVDLFGKIARAQEFAKANAQAEMLALKDLQVDIVASAVQAYGNMKGIKSRLALLQQNANSVDQTRAIVQARFDEGIASSLDVQRVETQYLGVLSEIPVLEMNYRRTKNFLESLLGSDKSLAFLDLDHLSQQALVLDTPFAIGDANQFLRHRPDVYKAERRLAAATAQIGASTAELYPDISISGFVGFLTGDISNLGSGTEAWRVSPSLSWGILDHSSIKSRIDIAKADERNAFYTFQETVLNAIKEVDGALHAHTQIQKRLGLQASQLKASKTAYELARELYESGEVGLLDLLDAERQVLNVEKEYVISNIQSFTSIVNVYKAFGGGIETLNNPAVSQASVKLSSDLANKNSESPNL